LDFRACDLLKGCNSKLRNKFTCRDMKHPKVLVPSTKDFAQ
jgi:hypothetical protein